MSEFGKGLSYCLALFYGHFESLREENIQKDIALRKRIGDKNPENSAYRMWFYAASDHLIECEFSKAPEAARQDAAKLDALVERRLDHDLKKGDVLESLELAKRILIEIDKAHGVCVELTDFP